MSSAASAGCTTSVTASAGTGTRAATRWRVASSSSSTPATSSASRLSCRAWKCSEADSTQGIGAVRLGGRGGGGGALALVGELGAHAERGQALVRLGQRRRVADGGGQASGAA